MLHPDVSTDPNAEEIFKILNEAYHILNNPETRSAYDARIRAHGSDEAEHMSYAGYRGTKYRDPSTWYDPYIYTKYNHTSEPDGPTDNNSTDKQNSQKKALKFNLFRHIFFYATLCMAIIILTKLVVIPVLDNINTQNADLAYQDGNAWMEEWEYQKAIESYTQAISLNADYTEAWRKRGYAELAKGVELDLLRPDHAQRLYLAAIGSLRMAIKNDMKENYLDLDTVKSLGNAYERMGMYKEAEIVYLEAKKVIPDDPEVKERLQLIQMYLLGFAQAPSTPPAISIRSRATG